MTTATAEPEVSAPRVRRSGYTEREPEQAITGRLFTPHLGLIDFRLKQGARLIEESNCATQGLQILAGKAIYEKAPCISPILVKGTDIWAKGGTLKKVISKAHPWWKKLFPSAPMTYALRCCDKHLRVIQEGDTVVFCTETFEHKGFDCLLCMRKGPVYGQFKFDCIPVDNLIDEHTWILFDRQRPR